MSAPHTDPAPHTELFRRHAAEGVLLLGGGAAILLQLADPRVARGVARHSDFAGRPLDRLFGTLDYIYAVGFGDGEVRRSAVRRVNARHAPVRGGSVDVDSVGAESIRYSAFDADAQRWVASTLLATALTLEERLWGSIDEARADAIVRGYAPLGASLQAGGEGWPGSRAEFDEWWHARLAEASVGDDARRVARTLLGGSAALPPGTRLMLPLVRLLTAALLPPPIRAAYGFRWTARAERVSAGWLRGVALVWPLLPAAVRHAPMRNSLRRVRRSTRYAEREA
ncbi:oxygenase MpaB family protein [Agromyces italicus]|uniref:oxygenase MpaB family protein n=1 Tax=Agromyces italicus TaxID=279572 RepID=UPI0003B74AD0|nr:oxygenase MpaB family protein [Agromyces italicus]